MTDLYSNPEIAKSLFFYRDGKIYWKKQISRVQAGAMAGAMVNGRLRVSYKGKSYGVHRIVYLMHNGSVPEIIDHIDGNPLNNRIENLREATQLQNMWNQKIKSTNKTGVKGVHWNKRIKKYYAACMVNGTTHQIGKFDKLEDAKVAVETFRAKHHGDFARNA